MATNIDQKSVICKSCNMIHTLDAEGNCEFCRRPRRDMLAKRDQRQNESQMLLTVLLFAGASALAYSVFGPVVFLASQAVIWSAVSVYLRLELNAARKLNKDAEIAVDMAQKAVDLARGVRNDEWADVIEGGV